jgi:hypothetical protein
MHNVPLEKEAVRKPDEMPGVEAHSAQVIVAEVANPRRNQISEQQYRPLLHNLARAPWNFVVVGIPPGYCRACTRLHRSIT